MIAFIRRPGHRREQVATERRSGSRPGGRGRIGEDGRRGAPAVREDARITGGGGSAAAWRGPGAAAKKRRPPAPLPSRFEGGHPFNSWCRCRRGNVREFWRNHRGIGVPRHAGPHLAGEACTSARRSPRRMGPHSRADRQPGPTGAAHVPDGDQRSVADRTSRLRRFAGRQDLFLQHQRDPTIEAATSGGAGRRRRSGEISSGGGVREPTPSRRARPRLLYFDAPRPTSPRAHAGGAAESDFPARPRDSRWPRT